MNKPTLLILAAGMASRYGSLKQLDTVGPSGQTIMDYSIYDAIQAGFEKIVFIIREEFFEPFKNATHKKWNEKIQLEYVFQSMEITYNNQIVPREKPWGTGHAVLSAKNVIKEPFCVINADDFYGRESFVKMVAFLNNHVTENHFAMVGYKIENTLSDNGSVSRGICTINENQNLIKVEEKTKIYPKENKIIAEEDNGLLNEIPENTLVSMNFWGLHNSIFDLAENMFSEFVQNNHENPKAEFYLPTLAIEKVLKNIGTVTVIPTDTKWFGVTYKQDKEEVTNQISILTQQNIYPKDL